MSKGILQFIVFLLAFLIFICFLALLYGFYIKIGKKQSNLEAKNITYNLTLEEGHEITDIDNFDFDDIEVLDYQHHPHISAPIAI